MTVAPGQVLPDRSPICGAAMSASRAERARISASSRTLLTGARGIRGRRPGVTVDPSRGVVLRADAARVVQTIPAAHGQNALRGEPTATRILANVSEPSRVARAAALDFDGIGLLRAD